MMTALAQVEARRQSVAIVGASHRSAPLEERERLASGDADVAEAGAAVERLLAWPGIEEAVALFTCNRVEFYVAGPDEERLAASAAEFIAEETGDPGWLERYGYVHRDRDAARHLLRVASSLDSLVVGEPQIVGQVKSAYSESQDRGGTGTLLHRLFHRAFATAKRVRTETGVAENAVTVSYAAVELAKKVLGDLSGRRVAVVGAGKMGTLAVRHLRQSGVGELSILNRRPERVRGMAKEFDAAVLGLDSLHDTLTRVDIVITSTGAQRYVIDRDLMREVMGARRHRPLFVVDIAVPRDVDPRCDTLADVFLFDVDDLSKVVEENQRARESEARRAESIVDEEVTAFERWLAEARVVPTIVELRRKLERIQKAEIERMKRSHPELDPEALEAAERTARAIVNKILHEPTLSLRESTTTGRDGLMTSAVRRLFNLAEEASTDASAKKPKSEPA